MRCCMGAYLRRTTNFLDLSSSGPQSCLSSNHTSCIAHHQYAHEGITVSVPPDNGFLVIFCDRSILVAFYFRSWNRHIDVANLVIHNRHQLNSSNLGYDSESLGMFPGLKNKFCIPEVVNFGRIFLL